MSHPTMPSPHRGGPGTASVIGAGLSGLAAAWHLAESDYAVTVFDGAGGPGGLIQTRVTDHGLVETGANAFVRDELVDRWFARLGLEPLTPRRASRRRYIFRDGKPRRWPLRIGESAGCAIRLAGTAIGRQFSARNGETMADWGTRVVGLAATEWLIEPAMQGVYATRAGELSASVLFNGRRHGRRELVAPNSGMGEFIERLHARLVARGVRFAFNSAIETLDTGVPTIIATGAPAAAALLDDHAPEVAAQLRRIRAASLATVTLFFEPHPDDLRGFGVLFPERSGAGALGVLFNADIFDGRSDVRSETWIVGDRGRGLTALPDRQLLEMLAADRYVLCGRHATPLSSHITRWPHAIPVYDCAIAELESVLDALPAGIAVTGNYLGRIGVAALLQKAGEAAARLATA
jgi:oxygen-dependent protoporphyrinogen oxidase